MDGVCLDRDEEPAFAGTLSVDIAPPLLVLLSHLLPDTALAHLFLVAAASTSPSPSSASSSFSIFFFFGQCFPPSNVSSLRVSLLASLNSRPYLSLNRVFSLSFLTLL